MLPPPQTVQAAEPHHQGLQPRSAPRPQGCEQIPFPREWAALPRWGCRAWGVSGAGTVCSPRAGFWVCPQRTELYPSYGGTKTMEFHSGRDSSGGLAGGSFGPPAQEGDQAGSGEVELSMPAGPAQTEHHWALVPSTSCPLPPVRLGPWHRPLSEAAPQRLTCYPIDIHGTQTPGLHPFYR